MTTLTHRFLRLFSLLAIALSVAALPATAANRILLELESISGESTLEGFKNAIDIEAFSWGLMNATTTSTTGITAGKPDLQDLAVSKHFDSTSPSLFIKAATGAVIPNAKLSVVSTSGDGKPQVVMQIKLENVIVSSLSLSESNGDYKTAENVTFAFTKISLTAFKNGLPGKTETFDLSKRK